MSLATQEGLWTQAGQVLAFQVGRELLVWVMSASSCKEREMQNQVLGIHEFWWVAEEGPRLDRTEHSSCPTRGASRSSSEIKGKKGHSPAGLRPER